MSAKGHPQSKVGMEVAVGGTGVAVGGIGVAVGGTGVEVGAGAQATPIKAMIERTRSTSPI